MSTTLRQDSLKNNIAIVTGAAQGIGYSIAEKFAQKGYFVVIIDINHTLGQRSAENLRGAFYPCDLSDRTQVNALADKLIQDLNHVDVIVHNARIRNSAETLLDHLENEWDMTINVMLTHPLLLTERLCSHLRRSLNPSIIHIGSTNAHFISQQSMGYHVAKGALKQAIRYLACTYGQYGIRVNTLELGIVDIPSRPRKEPQRFEATLNEVIPLMRAATLEEVGNCCYFLASENASFVTGTELRLDGGEHLKDHFQLIYSLNLAESKI